MFEIDRIIQMALTEDIGSGDITTLSTVPKGTSSRAQLVAKEDFVLAGMEVVERVFTLLDGAVSFEALKRDGEQIARGDVLAWIKGDAHTLLQGERVALNLMQRMSGIASHTAAFVAAVAGTDAIIVDTRKTMPGLRVLDKYSVRMGGGQNHRTSLYDGVLIKENHIAAAGGITAAIDGARNRAPHTLKIEVETESLQDVQEALDAGADIIMLDNMSLDMLREAVDLIGTRAVTEASGGVNLDTVADIAKTGVNLISVGALTHSSCAVDISMLFE
ncbi:carboxylating nicotinate-nucleotide diphosphorylase [uncultured Desulfuromonas sp.]|uniref:carboxylating nicotinate-nucleotide diphosphorylase n=1 Tax=uncultured Desulfuromonas sp. TaxID=181013 RepID=UPI002AAC4115|nr:carboxylating nicotinate-nucleotide diphosphorylase [uncultured Desulfuromonas sp.]